MAFAVGVGPRSRRGGCKPCCMPTTFDAKSGRRWSGSACSRRTCQPRCPAPIASPHHRVRNCKERAVHLILEGGLSIPLQYRSTGSSAAWRGVPHCPHRSCCQAPEQRSTQRHLLHPALSACRRRPPVKRKAAARTMPSVQTRGRPMARPAMLRRRTSVAARPTAVC